MAGEFQVSSFQFPLQWQIFVPLGRRLRGGAYGCGFPLIKIVGVFSLASGVLLAYAKGNQHQHELTLLHRLLAQFNAGDRRIGLSIKPANYSHEQLQAEQKLLDSLKPGEDLVALQHAFDAADEVKD